MDFSHYKDQMGETPIIIIERDDDEVEAQETSAAESFDQNTKRKSYRWLWIVCGVLCTLLVVAAAVGGYAYYRYHVNIGVPVSCTAEQNIEKLKMQTLEMVQPEVVMSSDTVLDVALNFYEMRGLRAEITFEEPDTLDESVYLYSRCADHAADGTYLGSLVVKGEEKQKDVSRLGYCAMVGNRTVIGIARSEAVKDYCIENGGSFFRQFILVSNGVIPHQFYLHGKVERRALGRIGEKYYYIETLGKETMWDFADALREYGFTDAIYITGGTDYCFYRSIDGARHDIGNIEDYPHKKWKGIIPWIVFKK